jgi:uncharacterized membrane protein (DUF106 family)
MNGIIKIIKWGLVVVVTVAATCVLLFTFMQEPFQGTAAAKLIIMSTPEFPLYFFALATFAMGLLVGFFAAAYYYIAGQAGIRSKNKEIKGLAAVVSEKENTIKGMEADIERMRKSAEKAQQKATESMKAMNF